MGYIQLYENSLCRMWYLGNSAFRDRRAHPNFTRDLRLKRQSVTVIQYRPSAYRVSPDIVSLSEGRSLVLFLLFQWANLIKDHLRNQLLVGGWQIKLLCNTPFPNSKPHLLADEWVEDLLSQGLAAFLERSEHVNGVGKDKEPTGIAKCTQAKGDLHQTGKKLEQVNTILRHQGLEASSLHRSRKPWVIISPVVSMTISDQESGAKLSCGTPQSWQVGVWHL